MKDQKRDRWWQIGIPLISIPVMALTLGWGNPALAEDTSSDPPIIPVEESDTTTGGSSIDDIVAEVEGAATGAVDEVKGAAEDLADEAKGAAEDLADEAKGAVEGLVGGFFDSLLGGILPGFEETIGNITGIFEDGTEIISAIETEIGDFIPELEGILSSTSTGGFPNPTQVGEEIELAGGMAAVFPTFSGQPMQRAGTTEDLNDAEGELNAEIARATAHATTFSDEAQEMMSDRIEGAKIAAEESGQAAQTSQGLAQDSSTQDVTQNIERNISNQLAEISNQNAILVGSLAAGIVENQQARVDRSMALVTQAEALQEVQTANTRIRNQDSSAAITVMSGAVQVRSFGEQ